MANEATITSQLQIQKRTTAGNLTFLGFGPGSFSADVTGTLGPTPGAVLVTTAGRDIYFTELTTPGFCVIANLEPAGGNYFEYGIKDPQTNVYYPLGEVLPGESYVIRLSRNLQEQYAGSGTGTTGPENYLRLKANAGTVRAFVGAFEK
jgi:hypothetical protein